MNADTAFHQRIGRLTALSDVLAAMTAIELVAPRAKALADARFGVLATDVVTKDPLPAAAVALRDGWAVDSESTRDAGPYAPMILQPSPQRLDAFAALPPGTDAVAPLDAVSALGGLAQIMAPVAPGEGVLQPGADSEAGHVLCSAGSRLRASDVAVLTASGIATVSVRQPRIQIVNAKTNDAILDAAASMLARMAEAAGAIVEIAFDLDRAFRDDGADAIIGVGGTGSGRDDRAVIALSKAGTVTCHGIGLAPGETSAFGTVRGRPVLLMPGRIDAALACWLVLGRVLVDRLSGGVGKNIAVKARLARKVTSAVGLAEVIPLARTDAAVTPLASVYLSLQSLARADGWLLVPAESEGYPAGTEIEMRTLR
jgi:molybdopterin biosynthesis enzyme